MVRKNTTRRASEAMVPVGQGLDWGIREGRKGEEGKGNVVTKCGILFQTHTDIVIEQTTVDRCHDRWKKEGESIYE